MNLIDEIKRDQLQARKDRDKLKTNLLTTLLSDIQVIGKNDGGRKTTDDEAVVVIKKFMKGINDSLEIHNNSNLVIEHSILEQYLPTQLSPEELKTLIEQFISTEITEPSPKQIGVVMGFLNQTYKGQFDGKIASSIVRECLSS